MRSLIKMEVSKYPVFDVLPINELPYNEQQSRYNGAATHHSMRNSLKRNSILSNNFVIQVQTTQLKWRASLRIFKNWKTRKNNRKEEVFLLNKQRAYKNI